MKFLIEITFGNGENASFVRRAKRSKIGLDKNRKENFISDRKI